ncbi:YwaF family protein [Mycoplasma sp. HS2188]|uniref:YwaF family protein n=1 Tax=Mycoplasma sp. HS2188 TaxID=2976765 RepID=UPI0021AA0E47|nr:YwaF family protein [Mycoplasma sp. HS2188]
MAFKIPEFFRWQGDNKSFYFEGISLIIFNVLFALTVLSMILLWLFKKPISRWFNNKNKHLIILSKVQLFRLIGSITLVFMFLRSVLLIISHFPTQWEALPFHLCRFMLLLSALCLVFNKVDYVKYFGHVAIIGALIALSKPDLNFENGIVPFRTGLDSYYFYDYILIHSFLILLTSALYIVSNPRFKAKDILYAVIFFFSTTIIIFSINWLTSVYANDSWKTNYFYLGKDEINSQKDIFGPLSKWPYNLFSWSILGTIVATISISFWFWQDSFYLDKINKKWVFVKQKSIRWIEFKNSFKR